MFPAEKSASLAPTTKSGVIVETIPQTKMTSAVTSFAVCTESVMALLVGGDEEVDSHENS